MAAARATGRRRMWASGDADAQALLHALIDHLPFGVLLFDVAGRCLYVNESGAALGGAEPGDEVPERLRPAFDGAVAGEEVTLPGGVTAFPVFGDRGVQRAVVFVRPEAENET